MPTEQELDQIFLAAAERAGGIQPLLTSFFGFLHRRTDFYIEHGGVKGQAYDAGFAPGQAEAMVRAAFMAHPTRPLEGSNVERSAAAHRAGCEATLVERARDRKARAPAPAPAPAARGADGRYDGVRYTDDGVQIPVGNGGIAATHSWTQTLYETTVTIDVPAAPKAKDEACKISVRGLTLDIAGGAVSLAGNWYDVIDAGASCWTLDRPGRDRACLVLTLEKTQETWWRSVFKDAPKADQIDAQKVDSTKRMDEYDEKTQAGIRKCMFDQRQRRRGLPTSEESQVDSILESAKNLPNSPFRTDGPPPDLYPPAPPTP